MIQNIRKIVIFFMLLATTNIYANQNHELFNEYKFDKSTLHESIANESPYSLGFTSTIFKQQKKLLNFKEMKEIVKYANNDKNFWIKIDEFNKISSFIIQDLKRMMKLLMQQQDFFIQGSSQLKNTNEIFNSLLEQYKYIKTNIMYLNKQLYKTTKYNERIKINQSFNSELLTFNYRFISNKTILSKEYRIYKKTNDRLNSYLKYSFKDAINNENSSHRKKSNDIVYYLKKKVEENSKNIYRVVNELKRSTKNNMYANQIREELIDDLIDTTTLIADKLPTLPSSQRFNFSSIMTKNLIQLSKVYKLKKSSMKLPKRVIKEFVLYLELLELYRNYIIYPTIQLPKNATIEKIKKRLNIQKLFMAIDDTLFSSEKDILNTYYKISNLKENARNHSKILKLNDILKSKILNHYKLVKVLKETVVTINIALQDFYDEDAPLLDKMKKLTLFENSIKLLAKVDRYDSSKNKLKDTIEYIRNINLQEILDTVNNDNINSSKKLKIRENYFE